MLDEPFSGVDPIAVYDVQQIIQDLRTQGLAILITDHNVRETLNIVDRAYLYLRAVWKAKEPRISFLNDPDQSQTLPWREFSDVTPMSKAAAHRVPHITVGHFYANHAETLGLRLEGASRGLNRKIREPTINRPGLALTGFYSYFAGKRIQVLGAAELSYLRSLPTPVQKEKLKQLFSRNFPCLVIARNAQTPSVLFSTSPRVRDAGLSHPHDHHEVYQRGHDRARIRFRSVHAGVWEHGGYSGYRHPDSGSERHRQE